MKFNAYGYTAEEIDKQGYVLCIENKTFALWCLLGTEKNPQGEYLLTALVKRDNGTRYVVSSFLQETLQALVYEYILVLEERWSLEDALEVIAGFLWRKKQLPFGSKWVNGRWDYRPDRDELFIWVKRQMTLRKQS